ncbi:prmC, partial [Ophiophagus hannah]
MATTLRMRSRPSATSLAYLGVGRKLVKLRLRGTFNQVSMDFPSARQAVLNVIKGARAGELPRLLHWLRTTNDFDKFTYNNDDIILRSIAEDIRHRLPVGAVLNSEHNALQKLHEQTVPTIHVDAFLYDDDCIDSLCEEGKMSRNYCLACGSHQTAPLEFISHSFSLMELKSLYQEVLPDLTGKVLVDVGSRLGAVLFGAYYYSSASQIYGVEMNGDFCQLQEAIISKYRLDDRIKVINADICTQASLLQNADIVVMNNVFEYFLGRSEQARAWKIISQNIRKPGSLLVTVPNLEKSLSELQVDIQLSQWVEAVPVQYDGFLEDADREALEKIYLLERR